MKQFPAPVLLHSGELEENTPNERPVVSESIGNPSFIDSTNALNSVEQLDPSRQVVRMLCGTAKFACPAIFRLWVMESSCVPGLTYIPSDSPLETITESSIGSSSLLQLPLKTPSSIPGSNPGGSSGSTDGERGISTKLHWFSSSTPLGNGKLSLRPLTR